MQLLTPMTIRFVKTNAHIALFIPHRQTQGVHRQALPRLLAILGLKVKVIQGTVMLSSDYWCHLGHTNGTIRLCVSVRRGNYLHGLNPRR